QHLIIQDLTHMNMNAGKYDAVESQIGDLLMDPARRLFFEEAAGKEMILEYCKAKVYKQNAGSDDVEAAIKKLREVIKKETEKGANTFYAVQFSRTMAELLKYARSHKN